MKIGRPTRGGSTRWSSLLHCRRTHLGPGAPGVCLRCLLDNPPLFSSELVKPCFSIYEYLVKAMQLLDLVEAKNACLLEIVYLYTKEGRIHKVQIPKLLFWLAFLLFFQENKCYRQCMWFEVLSRNMWRSGLNFLPLCKWLVTFEGKAEGRISSSFLEGTCKLSHSSWAFRQIFLVITKRSHFQGDCQELHWVFICICYYI